MIPLSVQSLVRRTLEEDLADVGDVTTACTVDPDVRGTAVIVAREPLVVSGLPVAVEVFRQVDPAIGLAVEVQEGDRLPAGGVLLRIGGPLASVLVAERPALNFLGRLCGVATHTRRFVDAVWDLPVRVVDTRKTTPGLRLLEKAAVRHGGASNHRFGLFDGILIKDNHVVACGDVATAVSRARQRAPHHLLKIGVEVDRLDQIGPALEAGAHHLLLDNMDLPTLAEAVRRVGGRATTEASGGVRVETIRAIAETGVDFISAGSLIHGARWVDLGLDFERLGDAAAQP